MTQVNAMVSIVTSGLGPCLTIGRGAAAYTQTDAQAVLAGFAFGTTRLVWPSNFSPPADIELGVPPRAAERPKWSYRIYDCAPNSPYAFGVNDLLLTAALDADPGTVAYLAMEAILPDLNEVLAHIDLGQTFWTLDPAHLGPSPPPAGVSAWWLWRAWALLMGLENVGVAVTCKTLHHKRPWFFPIFDNDTVRTMGGRGAAWKVLHGELNTQAAQFTHLEGWFAAEAANRGGVLLTRLRIHDILLWAEITGEREPLRRADNNVLERLGGLTLAHPRRTASATEACGALGAENASAATVR